MAKREMKSFTVEVRRSRSTSTPSPKQFFTERLIEQAEPDSRANDTDARKAADRAFKRPTEDIANRPSTKQADIQVQRVLPNLSQQTPPPDELSTRMALHKDAIPIPSNTRLPSSLSTAAGQSDPELTSVPQVEPDDVMSTSTAPSSTLENVVVKQQKAIRITKPRKRIALQDRWRERPRIRRMRKKS